jgi:hypothetical protein
VSCVEYLTFIDISFVHEYWVFLHIALFGTTLVKDIDPIFE